MKKLLLLLLSCPLLLFAQESAISVSHYDGSAYGSNHHTFANRFNPQTYLTVQLLNPAPYHQRNIKKVELIQNDAAVFYSVEFDRSGRVLEERRKGSTYTISYRQRSDTALQRDTLIQHYFSEDELMRSDTFITQYYAYQHHDTLISFSRQYSNTWYKGSLINEQNRYYNQKFLNKKIKSDEGMGVHYDVHPLAGNKAKDRIFLQRKLKINYDSSTLYPYSAETLDINFSAAADSGNRTLRSEQIKNHAFAKQFGSKNHRAAMADGAAFYEPVFFFPNTTCATGVFRASQERQRTSFGFTSRPDGLYDTFYRDYRSEDEHLLHSEQTGMRTSPDRSTILRFRYTYFD